MQLSPVAAKDDLVAFLKRDYANNLYFFTYLNVNSNPETRILVGKENGQIAVAIMITPVHCSISSLNIACIEKAAGEIPPINSLHVLGRSDYVERLLSISVGPVRDPHQYVLCQLQAGTAIRNPGCVSFRASYAEQSELVKFYNSNDMLYGAKRRLPEILNWGRAHYVRHNGEIVSCALTTTETQDAAMIGAVFTKPSHRKRGYASSCIVGLCQGLVIENKTPYLFYKTEDLILKGLYETLGFSKIGDWVLATIRS